MEERNSRWEESIKFWRMEVDKWTNQRKLKHKSAKRAGKNQLIHIRPLERLKIRRLQVLLKKCVCLGGGYCEGLAVAKKVGQKEGLAEKPVKRCHQISLLPLGDLPSQEIEPKRSGLGDSRHHWGRGQSALLKMAIKILNDKTPPHHLISLLRA